MLRSSAVVMVERMLPTWTLCKAWSTAGESLNNPSNAYLISVDHEMSRMSGQLAAPQDIVNDDDLLFSTVFVDLVERKRIDY